MFPRFRKKGSALSMQKAYKLLQKQNERLILDVRTLPEYQSGHLPQSISLPLQQIDSIASVVPDPSAPLFVYCRSGARSASAAQWLLAHGYQNVTDIGGILDWPGELVRS